MTKLSNRMSQSSYAITRVWADDVRTLEDELDRERALRMAAERERDVFEALAALHVTHLVRRSDGKRMFRGIDSDDEIASTGGVWVFGLSTLASCSAQDAARETEDLCNARMRTTHRRAQAAESRAIKAERQVATLQARLDGAAREMDAKRLEAWAQIEHEHCGSVIDRVRRICSQDYDAAYDLARDVLAELPPAKVPVVVARIRDEVSISLRIGETGTPDAFLAYLDMIIEDKVKHATALLDMLMRSPERDSPLFGQWEDKPHRCLYDACGIAREVVARLADIRAALACQPGHELDAIAALVSAK
jgi:hypothetical protein